MATKQETFDIVVAHLRTMNQRCSENGKCLYRGPNNSRCAVGCLIPDHLYDSRIEGIGNLSLIFLQENKFKWLDLIIAELKKHDISLLFDLQYVHDINNHWGNYGLNQLGERCLIRIAQTYNLTYP